MVVNGLLLSYSFTTISRSYNSTVCTIHKSFWYTLITSVSNLGFQLSSNRNFCLVTIRDSV
uniref:Uncharacterized protein n=1 Tax=Helianthus annuus TaxID=4232 RepID=A0A251UKW1_HELAN